MLASQSAASCRVASAGSANTLVCIASPHHYRLQRIDRRTRGSGAVPRRLSRSVSIDRGCNSALIAYANHASQQHRQHQPAIMRQLHRQHRCRQRSTQSPPQITADIPTTAHAPVRHQAVSQMPHRRSHRPANHQQRSQNAARRIRSQRDRPDHRLHHQHAHDQLPGECRPCTSR